MKSKFQLVFGQLSVSSWVKKGHEPSWAENPSARARLGLITSRYVNQLVDIESLMSTVKSTDNTQTHVEITEEKSSFGVQKLKVLQPEFSSFISKETITNCWELRDSNRAKYWKWIHYTQYPIIRNGDQRWALEFLKNIQFPDADRFFILQGWALAVS